MGLGACRGGGGGGGVWSSGLGGEFPCPRDGFMIVHDMNRTHRGVFDAKGLT